MEKDSVSKSHPEDDNQHNDGGDDIAIVCIFLTTLRIEQCQQDFFKSESYLF